MAKSKSGGTRAMLRGRIANDVYSIGKDGEGKKQQVVRSLAEQVANPQTAAQMKGRMIMSTVMQFISGASVILDHAFDGVAVGQPSISEAIRRNYALIKVDVAANPSQNNQFGLNKYQEKGVKQGAYIVSNGKVAVPVALTYANGVVTLASGATAPTLASLKKNLGFGDEDYITLVGVSTDGKFDFVRLHLSNTFAQNTTITSSNIADAILLEGNVKPDVAVSGGNITVTLSAVAANGGVIVTKKEGADFIHSACQLAVPTAPESTADTALPTYPLGTEKFLNGGDVASATNFTPDAGGSTGGNTGGGSDEDTPSSGEGGEG